MANVTQRSRLPATQQTKECILFCTWGPLMIYLSLDIDSSCLFLFTIIRFCALLIYSIIAQLIWDSVLDSDLNITALHQLKRPATPASALVNRKLMTHVTVLRISGSSFEPDSSCTVMQTDILPNIIIFMFGANQLKCFELEGSSLTLYLQRSFRDFMFESR